MLATLEEIARSLGITRLTASYYADNLPIRRLLHHTGQVVASGIEQGEGVTILDISKPWRPGRTGR
jgi:hypothetical protein